MNRLTTAIIASAVSLLPFVSSLLFFTGDKYHDIRIRFWNHDPSQFPESVAEKISIGAEVLANNVFKYVATFSLTTLIALVIVLWSIKYIEKIGGKLNPFAERFVSRLIRRPGNRINRKDENSQDKEPSSEIVVFMIILCVYCCVVASIVFSLLVSWASGSSTRSALRNEAMILSQYKCSLKEPDECAAKGLKALRITKYFFKSTEKPIEGFSVECSPTFCILFTADKKIIGVGVNEIQRIETIPPKIRNAEQKTITETKA